jgi:small subunit ribosomal protein S16
MLAIRLQRVGRKKLAIYRLVVSEKTKDTYGNHLEILGTYNPHNKEAVLKTDRIKHWLDNGAQGSESVHNLLVKEGVVEGDKKRSVRISNKRKAKMEGKKVKAEEEKTKAEEKPVAEEAPVEDKPEEVKEEPKAEEKSEEKPEEK